LPSESDTGQTPEGIPLPNIRERVLPVLERQGEELERSIEYFKNQYKKDLVHRMVLSGGGVGLKGLDRFLNRHFDIALEHCNVLLKSQGGPANRNRDATDPIGPALTVAAGLALGRCGKINVLPEEWRASFKKKLLKNVPVMVLALLLAVFGGMSVHLRQTRDAVRDQVSFQKAELAREKLKMEFLKKPVHLLASLKKENRQLQEEMESLQPGGPRMLAFFPPMLDELSHIVPSNVSLSEITFSVSQKGK
ncbi:MAG: hypothetical protein GWM98_02320, partial [Nitrospinaceae bacterium]|nr:hypothetical protein [Nitrospinaceae bacterium]NIR53544.1 hypothetical protein [Nitrospinaceae bacterium]NIS83945.1 hypothetical protein [Nitrospinaceae bacterium]NIT80754.1 hypothetical protein [Nitrospinaceae bacterium]NIU43060.1 hypothetical protein [Nitrospinaceae bacterium]